MDSKYRLTIQTTTVIGIRNISGEISQQPEQFVVECDEYPKFDNGMIKVVGRLVENNAVQARVLTLYFSLHNMKYIVVENKAGSDIVIPKIQLSS